MKRTQWIAALAGLAVTLAISSSAHARLYMMMHGSNVYPSVGAQVPETQTMFTLGGMPTSYGYIEPHVGRNVYPAVPVVTAHPDGQNLYQYVRSNPIRYVDPTGMWSESTHYNVTKEMALAVGYNEKCAKVLASWNKGVDVWTGSAVAAQFHFDKDSDGKPYPRGRTWWYEARRAKGEDKLRRANVYWSPWIWDVSLTDGLAHIGSSLHHRQDGFSHTAKRNAETPFDHAPSLICLRGLDGFGILTERCIKAKADPNSNWHDYIDSTGRKRSGYSRPDDVNLFPEDLDAMTEDTRKILGEIWKIPQVQCYCK